ncbi:MAG: SOS response-associated peptidase [Planctomycetaceae bacterium]
MCGRFTLVGPGSTLAKILDALNRPFIVPFFPKYTPKFNIAPTQYVPVIRQQDVVLMRWGLVPSWSKSMTGPPLFNARAETVAEKPSFRTAFKRRRCLIPADGFYEWQVIGPKQKQPHYITLRSGQPFAFAGLWETWHPQNGPPVESCTIITTAANQFMQPLHDRMPVILSPEEYAPWIDPELTEPDQLLPMLNQYPDEEMTEHSVSPLVGSVRNDSPDLIVPVD